MALPSDIKGCRLYRVDPAGPERGCLRAAGHAMALGHYNWSLVWPLLVEVSCVSQYYGLSVRVECSSHCATLQHTATLASAPLPAPAGHTGSIPRPFGALHHLCSRGEYQQEFPISSGGRGVGGLPSLHQQKPTCVNQRADRLVVVSAVSASAAASGLECAP